MSEHDRDEKLREAFARLRNEVGARTPDATAMLSPKPASRRATFGSLTFVGAASTLLVVGLVMFRSDRTTLPGAGRGPLADSLAFASYPWHAPTDFLLELPGADLARTTPSFDVTSLPIPAIEPPASEGTDGHLEGRSTR